MLMDLSHIKITSREKFDELFGTEPLSPDQTPALPQASEAFRGIAGFIKMYKERKDEKRFEILTR